MTKDNADYGLYVHYVRSAIPKCHGYQELHAHSEASFRDAVNKVDDFVETAKGYGRQAFAITDHGNQMRLYQGIKTRTKDEKKNLEAVLQEANVPEDEIHKILKSIGDTDSIRYPTDKMWPYVKKYCKLFLKAAEKSIQFVPGMEAYFQPEKVEGNRDSFHLILYAKDWNGQKTLFKLENLAQLNKSPKGKWNGQETGGLPRMTWADLERFVGPGTEGHGHLIATSACVGGYIPYLILRPWYIADKQHAISMALAKLGDAYTEEDVKQAEQDLVDVKEKATKAKADLRDLKKLSGKDYEKKKAQLEKKIEKLKAVVGDFENGTEQSAVLDENIDENDKNAKKRADLKKAVITLRAVIEEQEKAEQLIAREAEIKAEAEQAPKRLACAKERLAEVEKGARPYIKQMGKYRALEAEKVRVFGYGGYLLSQRFNEHPAADLPEVPLLRLSDGVLFYGRGTVSWTPDSQNTYFVRERNFYSDEGYYFLTDREDIPEMETEIFSSLKETSANRLTTFNSFAIYEKDAYSWAGTGRQLYEDNRLFIN